MYDDYVQCTYDGVFLKVKGYLCKADSMLPLLHGFQRLNSGHKACTVSDFTVQVKSLAQDEMFHTPLQEMLFLKPLAHD